MGENKRLANYELLRVVAMVMVVVLHFLSHSESLLEIGVPASGVRILGTLLESFCLVAVNVYLLISGYFGVKSSFKPGKAISLLFQIWFYALLILGVMTALGQSTKLEELGIIYGSVQYLFPIETEHYWFATSYFMLYLLSPVLNAAVRNMSQKQMQITLTGLLVLFCGIKSFSPVVFPLDQYGYDLPWFICVYLTGAYMRLYGLKILKGIFEKQSLLVYCGSSFFSFLMAAGLWFMTGKSDAFAYYFTVPFHYNFILCFTAAIGLFCAFSKVTVKEGRTSEVVRTLGSLSFGVYLFHEHIDLRYRWYGVLGSVVNPEGQEGILLFAAELIFCVVILFMTGIVIDYIRSLLFGLAAKALAGSKLSLKVKEWEQECR